MKRNSRHLAIIALVAVVNALGYGIIIPLMYAYGRKFGLTDFQNGILIATFSLCQFLATPILGRLSDAWGRKPVLAVSLAGSAISFLMLAFAPNAIILFLARAIDGITAGTIPVAQAVISDSTDTKNRAKGFGIIGAAFGFGFVFGPAISAFTVHLGDWVPFVIAATVATVAVVLTVFFLPETNRARKAFRKDRLFDFRGMAQAAFTPTVGVTLIMVLLYMTGFNIYTYAFQPYAFEVLGVGVGEIARYLTVIGLVGIIAQAGVIPVTVKRFGERRSLSAALVVAGLMLLLLSFITSYLLYVAVSVIFALAQGFVMPILQTILSKEADETSQGSILGLSASYGSIGMILGPVIGGALVTIAAPLGPQAASTITLSTALLSFEYVRKRLRGRRI